MREKVLYLQKITKIFRIMKDIKIHANYREDFKTAILSFIFFGIGSVVTLLLGSSHESITDWIAMISCFVFTIGSIFLMIKAIVAKKRNIPEYVITSDRVYGRNKQIYFKDVKYFLQTELQENEVIIEVVPKDGMEFENNFPIEKKSGCLGFLFNNNFQEALQKKGIKEWISGGGLEIELCDFCHLLNKKLQEYEASNNN